MSHRLPHHHVTRTTLRLLVLVMGLFAVGWLVYRYRVDVWRAISAMGAGIIWLAAVYALHLAIAAIGWRALVRSARW